VDVPMSWLGRRLPAVGVAALAAGLLLLPAGAAEKKGVTVDEIAYQGWKHNLRLSNGDAELIVTLDVGPRVISYKPAGGKNVFKEFTDQLGKSGEKDWQARGGHRLWTAPEDLTRTYAPDNAPVKYQELPARKAGTRTVRFTQAPDTPYGVQKEMDVTLAPTGSRVEVIHRITNVASQPTDLAAWALTMMAPGGTEVIPLPPHRPHPGPPQNARSPADFAPSMQITLWPYFDFTDKRWTFGSKYITLHQNDKQGPTKIGLTQRMGWVGYLNGGTLFVKRFGYQPGQHYPDGGCNFETFTNQEFLEMESLGPLVHLNPGAKVEHTENWDLHKDVGAFHSEDGIDKNVLPVVKEK
jgi:hypothetical protein